MDIRKIGIVGGGTMGAGIMQTLSSFGYPVHLKDVNDEVVKKCLDQVTKIYMSAVKKGKLTEEQAAKGLSLITGSAKDEGIDDADLVIEAVPENLQIKKQVFSFLEQNCKPDAVLATNTSSLSVSQLATFTSRAPYVIGMHWFNPPHIMKLIEIVPGMDTSSEVLQSIVDFCNKLDKIPIQVKECAGFLVNRVLGIYMNEAIFMLEDEKVPALIDQAAIHLGMPMGPLMLGDMVGWDVIYNSNLTLFEEYGMRFAIPQILARMVKEGQLGQKAKNGIYPERYEPGNTELKNVDVEQLQALSNRLLFVMLNEGIRCLEEKVASAQNIDTALRLGAGMPQGPINWADDLGLDILLHGLMELKSKYGERFRPSPLLRRSVLGGYLGKKSGKELSLLNIRSEL